MALPPPEPDHVRSISLCAGVGGLDLGLAIAEPGFRTVCYVERDIFAASVLVARMADKSLCEAPVWDDLATFDGRSWRGAVDIVLAGYLCQPFSSAGSRSGENDPRHLWPHVRRIIDEARPRRVFLENVEGHVSLGFGAVRSELAEMGYGVRAGLFSAAEAGAAHWRRRLFVLADADSPNVGQPGRVESDRAGMADVGSDRPNRQSDRVEGSGPRLDVDVEGGEGDGRDLRQASELGLFAPPPFAGAAWEQALARQPGLEPSLHGLDHGVAHWLDRSRSAGNGVCPLAAALAYRTLEAAFTTP